LPEAIASPSAVIADTIMHTIELGMTIADAVAEEKTTTIFRPPVARDRRCPGCGSAGRYGNTVTQPLTDLRVASYPLMLQVAVTSSRCATQSVGVRR
jgi:hypothetical protein